MSGKAILIVVLGFMSISFVSYETIMTHSNESSKTISDYYYEQQAYNISQTGINMTIKKLEIEPEWRTGYYYKDLFGGLVYVQLKDTLFDNSDVVKITSSGIMGYNTKDEYRVSSIAYLTNQVSVSVPVTIKAAVTANSKISTSGKMIIDGRDHDVDGNLIAGEGTYALWTTNAYSRSGNSKIGGSKEGKDFEPSKTVNDNVRKHNQKWETEDSKEAEKEEDEDEDKGKKDKDDDDEDDDDEDEEDEDDSKKEITEFPVTPEEALGGSEYGFTPNKLKEIAQSGKDGSQYVTDPSQLKEGPLSGITYVELGNKQTWQSVDVTGSGILIVHNDQLNAVLKNLNKGTFKGIIIADNIINIHTDIIGAVFTLTSKTSGSVIGNGNGQILYSSEAIENALTGFATGTSTGESGKKGVVAWWN